MALNLTAKKHAVTTKVPFGSVLDEAKMDVCKKIKGKCKINVVGALFGDTKGIFFFKKMVREKAPQIIKMMVKRQVLKLYHVKSI